MARGEDIMRAKSPMEQSVEEYLRGKIEISNINKFTKYKNAPHESYRTTKGAFIFPLSGKCEIYFDDEMYVASAGTVIHGCPDKTLRFHVLSEEPFVYINLYYNTVNQFTFQHSLDDAEAICKVLDKLIEQFPSNNQINMIQRNYLLSTVFDSLYKDYITPEARNNYELVNEAAAYIKEHYMLDLSLDFLAHTFGKTSNQFSYLFYTYKNIRPIQYLISCRLSISCDLLVDTSLPIQEIAHRVGYEDALFFSRLFKRHMGCSPKQFRAVYGNDHRRRLSSHDSALSYLSTSNS